MEYVRQAATSAETASGAASSASGSASAASGSASSAAQSASAAAGSASTAHTDAETASQAAQTAQNVAASIPEDYSTLSDDVTGLKSAINPLYAVMAPQIIANSYWPFEGSSSGRPSYYSGWSRTDRLPCVEGETLKITTTAASAYNVFFNTDTDGDVNGHFNLVVGENSILVPQGAHYYALSNTTSDMNNTIIKKMIDGTAVNNGIDSITEIDNVVNGIKTPISYQSPTSGSYYVVVGNAISLTSGSGSYFQPIDLSAYVGQKVRVAFSSTGTTSTRATALCDANGVVGAYVDEKVIAVNGYADFDIGSTYNRLYISYNTSGSSLVVTVIDGGILYEIEEIPMQCVYVSATVGDDGNSGSETAPFATIQKGIDSGALIVRVEAGNYANFGVLNRKTPLTIMLWDMPQYSASVPEVSKIVVTSQDSYGVYFANCIEINLSDIWVNGSLYDCYRLDDIGNINCIRCFACDTSDANSTGFRITNSNGIFRDCKAWDISKDGFNIHLYGNTQFINCVAYDCGDDGISHHEGCTGAIIGGEYYNCTKGGVASPYSGAQIDVHNVYSHNNRFGLYAMTTEGNPSCKGRVSNCVFKNNSDVDIDIATNGIIGWNNIYDTKYVYPGCTFTEF
jgi:hypothetical protein